MPSSAVAYKCTQYTVRSMTTRVFLCSGPFPHRYGLVRTSMALLLGTAGPQGLHCSKATCAAQHRPQCRAPAGCTIIPYDMDRDIWTGTGTWDLDMDVRIAAIREKVPVNAGTWLCTCLALVHVCSVHKWCRHSITVRCGIPVRAQGCAGGPAFHTIQVVWLHKLPASCAVTTQKVDTHAAPQPGYR